MFKSIYMIKSMDVIHVTQEVDPIAWTKTHSKKKNSIFGHLHVLTFAQTMRQLVLKTLRQFWRCLPENSYDIIIEACILEFIGYGYVSRYVMQYPMRGEEFPISI